MVLEVHYSYIMSENRELDGIGKYTATKSFILLITVFIVLVVGFLILAVMKEQLLLDDIYSSAEDTDYQLPKQNIKTTPTVEVNEDMVTPIVSPY